MARVARVLYQTQDAEGWPWDVREERLTPHGFSVLLGWPFGIPRGKFGSGGPAAIPTPQLVAYMQAHRDNPGAMDLPVGKGVVTRLRRLLGHHRYRDRAKWWEGRLSDLLTLTGAEFVAKHPGVTESAASLWRRRLGGERRARSENWWMEPKTLGLLQSGMSTYALAHALGISTAVAYSGRQRAMEHQNAS